MSDQWPKWFFNRGEKTFDVGYFGDAEFNLHIGGFHDSDDMFVSVTDKRRSRVYSICQVDDTVVRTTTKLDDKNGLASDYRLSQRQRRLMRTLLSLGARRSAVRFPGWARPHWRKALELVS